jgi:uncharacterized protein (DUF1800 family)
MFSKRLLHAAFLPAVAAASLVIEGRSPIVAARANELPNDERTIAHVQNRMAFGARPGDIERIQTMGLREYIEQQLHPERIPDSAVSARLATLATTGLTSRQISERFEQPILELRRQARQKTGPEGRDQAERPPELMDLQQLANSVVLELSEQKVLRAAYSERQLQEVLADFWFNHFNVDVRKGRDRFFVTEYERETIRPHVFGKFRDLLEATAKSPAMLFYLDNWMSTDPNGLHAPDQRAGMAPPPLGWRRFPGGPFRAMPQQRPQPPNTPKGLNENYGRELMELHTLGVDGGYTQKDVTEVARAFTGWTIRNPRLGGGFHFEPRMHDTGEKVVLGHRINVGGIGDGEQVLDILARHPSTARFISTKLARHFVSDTPPPALVNRLAARFTETGGDLREVMRALLTSPELLSGQAFRAKVKTPFEFVVSAVRATAADVADARPLVRGIGQLGMPLYQCQPPTGYKDTAEAWATSGSLVHRMNIALALGRNTVPGVVVDTDRWMSIDRDALVSATLGFDISAKTRATISKATAPPEVVALTLGSPEFQTR